MGVYHQPPIQDDCMSELFDKQPEVSGSIALIVMADFKFPDINTNWEYHTATVRKSGEFQKHAEDNFLSQVLSEPTRKSAPPKPVV